MAFYSAFKNTFFLWVLMLLACRGPVHQADKDKDSALFQKAEIQSTPIVVGAGQSDLYLPLLKGKKIGIVANQTSVIFTHDAEEPLKYTHLVDSLLSSGVDIRKVFAPEHGFRGQADAGEKVEDGVDKKTGLSIVSLYGKNKKPSPEQLSDIDLVLFDIQDVGVRFYTYIATLQLVMEACADLGIPVIILDRPNPNAHYIDGPTMEPENKGFLGLNPIPLVYGMTIGEYAQMINKEGWLEGKTEAKLTVIPLKNYTHQHSYDLPIRPSPNLPNAKAINLYPSLGLFEGTNINAGRGTSYQFQRFGAPFLNPEYFSFSYVPTSNFGAKYPKHKDITCYGRDVSNSKKMKAVRINWLIEAYGQTGDKAKFFNTNNFTKHAGTASLQEQIEKGWTEEAIRKTWEDDIKAFRSVRAKYLIYD